MKFRSQYASVFGITMLILGLAVGAIAPYLVVVPVALAATPANAPANNQLS